jgi:hypothetical protein
MRAKQDGKNYLLALETKNWETATTSLIPLKFGESRVGLEVALTAQTLATHLSGVIEVEDGIGRFHLNTSVKSLILNID